MASWRPKLLFLLAEGCNTLMSQGWLVLLLGCSGYWTSRLGVFRRRGNPWPYAAVVMAGWLVQWQALRALLTTGLSKPVAVAALVPLLALSSYALQRRLVFR